MKSVLNFSDQKSGLVVLTALYVMKYLWNILHNKLNFFERFQLNIFFGYNPKSHLFSENMTFPLANQINKFIIFWNLVERETIDPLLGATYKGIYNHLLIFERETISKRERGVL